MSGEIEPSLPDHNLAREQFLTNLSGFIIEAGKNGWAAESPRVEVPQRPCFKELSYVNGEWEYRDSYAGYFMAPGSSVVYYRGAPVWYMTYGGEGQKPEHFGIAKETFEFLRNALMNPDPRLPIRGPWSYYSENMEKAYWFNFEGNLGLAKWDETIMMDSEVVFSQRGDVGLIIGKDENRQPVYPWTLD